MANTCAEDVLCCSANLRISSLMQLSPREIVSQCNFTVGKFNNIQLKFSFINVIPLLLAACSISLLSLQCLCTQAICRMLSSPPLAAACLK